MKRQDAPGDLELVRKFLNTSDLERGTDELMSVAQLREWLTAHRLLPTSATVTADDLDRARGTRTALRGLARTSSGAPFTDDDRRALTEVAAAADVRLRFGRDGSADVSPAGEGRVPAALGCLVAIAGLAVLDGTWARLKICPAEDCAWAFYDHSKNRSGRWCQMAECGNRAKNRTFRERSNAGRPSGGGEAKW